MIRLSRHYKKASPQAHMGQNVYGMAQAQPYRIHLMLGWCKIPHGNHIHCIKVSLKCLTVSKSKLICSDLCKVILEFNNRVTYILAIKILPIPRHRYLLPRLYLLVMDTLHQTLTGSCHSWQLSNCWISLGSPTIPFLILLGHWLFLQSCLLIFVNSMEIFEKTHSRI